MYTSGKRNANDLIAIVGIPPVAIHALRIEVAGIHEIAVGVQGIVSFMHIPSMPTRLRLLT